MSEEQDLLGADSARREAMVSGNSSELANFLSDDLVWTHSSGRTDNKAAILETIESKSVEYLSLQTEDVRISQYGEIFLCSGRLNGRVSKEGAQRDLRNKFLSVWRRRESVFEMLAWQSTGFDPNS